MKPVDLANYQYLSIAPGRVNLLGEHVDYNDGPVLPAAIDLAVRLYFQPTKDNMLHLKALDLDEEITISIKDILTIPQSQLALPGWALYPAGVAWSLAQQSIPVGGLDAAFTSNIPMGSGLSSSAAVECAFAAAWNHLSGDPMNSLQLTLAARKAENDYVGVSCGIMDQFASVHGVENHAIYLNTRTLEWHPLPLPPQTVIIIADSTIRRSLQHSGYNERRRGCEEAVSILSEEIPGIKALRDVNVEQFNKFAHLIPHPADIFARHVVEECARVDLAIPLLQMGDIKGFGDLMFDCHRSLRDLYLVSIPELDSLVDIARHTDGVYGARLTGAGFGGCTVNLVDEKYAESVMKKIKSGYLSVTGLNANVTICHASQGVRVITNQ